MTVKNLGHYEGIVEELPKDKTNLDKIHMQLIYWNSIKEKATKDLDEANNKINQIKEEIKPDIEKGLIKWAWIWIKKRTNIKWKEEFERYLGKQKIHEVMSQYEATEYPQIGIQYIDPVPESIQLKEVKKPIIKKLKLRSK